MNSVFSLSYINPGININHLNLIIPAAYITKFQKGHIHAFTAELYVLEILVNDDIFFMI